MKKKFLLSFLILLCLLSSVSMAETMLWQTISLSRLEKINVIYEHPANLQLDDSISFYCEFENCDESMFNFCWQYASTGGYWTNFGSKPRLDTTYCAMLAGKHIRLIVTRK